MEAFLSALARDKKENTLVCYRRDLTALSASVPARPLAALTREDLTA